MATKPNSTIRQTQNWLIQLGYKPGIADGIWGKNSEDALQALKDGAVDASKPFGVRYLTWGSKLGGAEIAKVAEVIKRLGQKPMVINDLVGCMAWETDKTLSPAKRSTVSSATGLIQFMEATATKELGTTTAKLATMTFVEQMEYVYKYFSKFKSLANIGDIYMAILWPRGVGKPDDYPLWTVDGDYAQQYKVNRGLDLNEDGTVTRRECMHRVNNRLVEGFLPQNAKSF